jgi:hypothetical protein
MGKQPHRSSSGFHLESFKDYAQWISAKTDPENLESFIAFTVHERTARNISAEHIQELIRQNPTLLILDGLDEVTDRELRQRMLGLLRDFITRSEVLKADLQVICTSRPTGYTDQFDPAHFIHLTLESLDRPKIMEYTTKWIKAKKLEDLKGKALIGSVSDCLGDSNFSSLMNTPLQVTIFILIILSGGTPPRQREELFNEYLEVIYKRERSKSKTIIQTEKRLLFGLHQYLGYVLQHRAAVADTRSKVSESEFRTAVLGYLRHDDPFSPDNELQTKAEQIIQEAHERLVLLVQPEDGFFGFELRSIQEFFAAGYLVDTAVDNAQRFERFQAVAIPPHWRNVALFFAGRVGRLNRGESAHILETCREIDRYKPDLFVRKGAWLALDIAVDRSFGPVRPLQRSGLEIALSMLDGDFSPERRTDLLSRLRQLPHTDIEQHVVPLLKEKPKKARFHDGFAILDVFCGLVTERRFVEDWFRQEIPHTTVAQHIILRKALRYRLRPQFVAEMIQLDPLDEQTLRELTVAFNEDAQFAVDVLKAAKVEATVALDLCIRTVNGFSFVADYQIPPLDFPEALYDQSVLAWHLFGCASAMRRGNRRVHGLRIRDVSFPQLEKLTALITHPDATPVLRAGAWSVVSRVAFLQGYETVIEELSAAVRSWSPEELLALESTLRRVEAPSIELLTRLDGRLRLRPGRHRYPSGPFEMHDDRDFAVWVLSSVGFDDCLTVLQSTPSKKKNR